MNFVRKVDDKGIDYVGKVRQEDLGSEMLRSYEILKKVKKLDLVFEGGTSGRGLNAFLDVPAGSDYILPFDDKLIKSQSVEVYYHKGEKQFQILKSGLYFVGAWLSVNLPIEGRHASCELLLKKQDTLYLLDGVSTRVNILPAGVGYMHFVVLQGWIYLYLLEGTSIQFIFRHESDTIPPSVLNQVFSLRVFFNFVNDGLEGGV